MKNENTGVSELYLAPEETKSSGEITQPENASGFEATKKHRKHKRLEEIPNQRGKNLKVFRMNDGTEQAVFSPASIHVFDDETQTFEDVDCTLTQDKDGKHFTCGKNHFVARFSNEDDNDEIFSIEQGKHKVTVCVGKNPRRKNHFVNPHLHKKDGIRTTDILTFANVEPDTDFEYSVEGNGVKENIVVKKPCESYRYPFALRCENVTARFDERAKRVAFISNESKNEVFFIPAPFMTDANGLTSTAVNFEVKEDYTSLVLLTVTAGEDWMNAPERAFPVVIDPQIQLSGSSQMTTYSWDNGQICPDFLHKIGTIGNSCETPSNDACISEPTEKMKSATVIGFDTPLEGTIAECGDETWYQFVANDHQSGLGAYTISTEGTLDTVGELYDENAIFITRNDDSNKLNFSITANLTYSKTYYLRVTAYGSNTGNYTLTVTHANACPDQAITPDDPYTDTVTCYTPNRMYMDFTMPTLPRNPRIKKAELQFFQYSAATGSNPLFGLYQVTDEIVPGDCTPIYDSDLIDYARMRPGNCEDCSDSEIVSYTFDITTLVDRLNKGESNHSKLVLKLLDESISSQDNITLFGSAYGGEYAPKIVMTYESSYGVNTSYRTHTHELGRFGQGSVDLQCGNLMLESEDFAWAGNRMPVTVKHLFNSALAGYAYTENNAINLCAANFSAMQIGLGFKLNLMQSMIFTSFVHDGKHYDGYVYIGENGEETYFKPKVEQDEYCNYELYEDVNGGDMCYNCISHTLTQGEETYLFNECGRLVEITDASGNRMEITYASDRITAVSDGAGRRFSFDYTDCGQLISITAPDGTKLAYTYTCELLTGISYPDGKTVEIIYDTSDKPASVILSDANGETVYKVAYTFSGNRLASVTEYGSDGSMGARSTYAYSVASARTVVTTTELADTDEGDCSKNVIRTVYTFDDDGNTVSEYVYSEDTGNVGGDGEESGINPHSGDGGAGVVSNINNLLQKHNFESFTGWSRMSANSGNVTVTNYMNESNAKFGKKPLRMYSKNAALCEGGVYQVTNSLPAGQYTFSAYLRVLSAFSGKDAGAYIRVCDTCGNVLGVSERLSAKDSEYTRLIVPFTLDCEQSVEVQILVNGMGTVYADAAQLENNPYANAYNMLENGNFERGTSDWTYRSSGISVSTDTHFNMTKSLAISGSIVSQRYAGQNVTVKSFASTRETFTLSGWAKGWGLPNHEREDCPDSTFRLRAVITYGDGSSQTVTADFSPCTEEWQFTSVQFAKEQYKAVTSLRVYCDYGYNSGVAYFDDVQLVRNSIETNLSASDFVVESTEDTESDTAEVVETETTPPFEEAKDLFGNTLTETTFTDGEFGTIYRAFGFAEDGNDLLRETDARGNETQYEVDKKTSRNEEITDRLGNKTAYEYDDSGRTTKVTSKNADGAEIATVSYAYDAFDNMTEIARGNGMKYALAYNAFHNLESIGVDGKAEKLIHYTYKNGNGRLKQMTYANGDTMKATYNSIGQMVAETWTDACGVETARYKYVYDGEGNIVRSIDIFAKKEYNYEYEEGKIVRATESDIEIVNNIVTLKVLVNTVRYYYSEDNLSKKVIIPVNGTAQTIFYETTDDNTVVKFSAGGKTVTSHSKTDSFGRKVFDELQLGGGFVSREFDYVKGAVTDEHVDSKKLKSSPTTQLVSRILLSDGRTIAYEYDAEERITKVTDSIDGVTEYTYDALGQLLTERLNGHIVNSMTYDTYGNIVSKNGKTYSYDSTWKDLLLSVDGEPIVYDAQGNPTTYLGHTLTWEKGRQLKSFDGNTYTYNANGIRTSKTVNGVKHTYTLDGTKILREEWNGNVLIPLYDNEDSVCGIIYNKFPYYFLKNLQGDVIAITNSKGDVVARYTYDAWGECTIVSDNTGIIARINPYRYRGYYFDQETTLYCLDTRYYSSAIGRFLNADEQFDKSAGMLGYNLFSYCANSPIICKDDEGEGITLICILVGAAIGLALGGTIGANKAKKKGYTLDDGWQYWKYVVGYGVVGGAVGALIGWGAGTLIAKYGVTTAASSITKGGGARFSSFNSLKKSLGSAGKGKDWHHIVEQCQIKKSGFSKYWIHNSNNVVNISKSVHQKVSAHYSSKIPNLTKGKTVREWLAGQSFKKQYEYGIKLLRKLGVKI